MSHVYIYSGLCGAIIVLSKIVTRKEVHLYEKVGTTIAILGCIISVFDEKAGKVNPKNGEGHSNGTQVQTHNIIIGDLIAFGASLFALMFFTYNKEAQKKLTSN